MLRRRSPLDRIITLTVSNWAFAQQAAGVQIEMNDRAPQD